MKSMSQRERERERERGEADYEPTWREKRGERRQRSAHPNKFSWNISDWRLEDC